MPASDEESSPEQPSYSSSSQQSPIQGKESESACSRCSKDFSVSLLRYRCRTCNASVCSSCCATRLKLGPEKEKAKVCDPCAAHWRAENGLELKESVDVRMELISSLKVLLREKYEEVEDFKLFMVEILKESHLLQEPPSLTEPFRFSTEMGLERINFTELLLYTDKRIKHLRERFGRVKESVHLQESQLHERRRNYGFLCERTQRSEADAARVAELVMQRDRLRSIYREQANRLRAFKDRIELLENQSYLLNNQDDPDLPAGIVHQGQYLGDNIASSLLPCLD